MAKAQEDSDLVEALLDDEEIEELRERLWKKLEPLVTAEMKKRRESPERPN